MDRNVGTGVLLGILLGKLWASIPPTPVSKLVEVWSNED